MTQGYSIEALAAKLDSIKGAWHLGTHQGNDGNPGNTLEKLLGISENNLRLPDFGTIEVKAITAEKSSLFTLFHKEPLPAASMKRLIKCFGWKHQKAGDKYAADEMRFTSTTGNAKHTVRGFRIHVDGDKIHITFDKNKINRAYKDRSKAYPHLGAWADDIETRAPHYSSILPVYWLKEDLIAGCITKLEHTFVCFCNKKTENGLDYFKYIEAYIYSGFMPERIEPVFAEGGLFIDIDARSGHNHGIKLRVKRKLLAGLFRKARKLL